MALALAVLFVLYTVLPAGLGKGGEAFFQVTAGSGARVIGRNLQAQGLVRSADVFALWTRLLLAQGKLKAGEYRLYPGMTPPQIVLLIKNGHVASSGVVIPEGYTLSQIAESFAAAKLVSKEEFLELAHDSKAVLQQSSPFNPPNGSLEGYLFPDTYQIAPGTPTAEVLQIMLRQTEQTVLPLLDQYKMPAGFNLHKLITLASIVEKEAQLAEERPLIAGVFLNRLERGMPLQSDPTVKYVLSPAPIRLSNDDISIDSPYNTYRFKGLPPGPIANPGLASIKAVLSPTQTTYLYFVARGDGSHVFSNTFKEHVAARKEVGSL